MSKRSTYLPAPRPAVLVTHTEPKLTWIPASMLADSAFGLTLMSKQELIDGTITDFADGRRAGMDLVPYPYGGDGLAIDLSAWLTDAAYNLGIRAFI